MAENWSLITKEVSAHRTYVKNLTPGAAAEAKFCYLLSTTEFNRLLALKGDGTQLDGVRIYLGAKEIDGQMVPTVHVVAVEKEGETYNDYNVPKQMPEAAEGVELFGAAPGPGSSADLPPCPAVCGGQNILNS
jgi:hypothetical protein